jgi:outer membrane lipoprotein-sorting protein
MDMKNSMHFRLASLTWLLLIFVGLQQPAFAQQSDPLPLAAPAPLNAEQVVQNLVRMNLERAQALLAYQGTRIYRIEYHGFPSTRSAEMVVDVKYQSPGTKAFTILSATGSKVIIDKVFKKLLQGEKEALEAENQKRTALNNDNYVFTLIGCETTLTGSVYLLLVEPRTKDKFLYRGRIWVDAEDFAVVRMEVEPAKNPSFWTKNAEVEQAYVKVSGFWLPAQHHSLSTIRLLGRADLTIDYKDYQITGASSLSNLSSAANSR